MKKQTNYAMKHFVSFRLLALLLCFFSAALTFTVSAQESKITQNNSNSPNEQKKVSGIVTDQNGEPIIGASIIVKGTSRGTITDVNGKFTLDNVNSTINLTVSYIGYMTKSIAIGSKTRIDVILAEDSKALDEVVVVGYGTQKKSDLTGSITQISAADLNKGGASNLNVAQMLEGRVAGLTINQHNADPGSDPTVLVRGDGTLDVATTTRPDNNNPNPLYNPLIGNSADPLVIVDGFPLMYLRDMNTIAPNDIQTVTVLKDASSTAIYGARGSNGVILITTKKGKSGNKVNINYSVDLSSQVVAKELPLLNDKQYLNFYNQLSTDPNFKLNNSNFNLNQQKIDSILTNDGGGTNWQRKVAVSPSNLNQSHNLSFSGQTGFLSYALTGSYLSQYASVAPNKYQRYNGKARVGYDDGKFAVDVSLAYSQESNNNNKNDYYGAVISDPSQSVYKSDGSFSINRFTNLAGNTNPMFIPTVTTDFWQQNSTFVNTNLRYEIMPGLIVRGDFDISKYNYQAFYNSQESWNNGIPNPSINSASATYRYTSNTLGDLYLDYTKMIFKKQTINFMLGSSVESKAYSDIVGTGTNFANNSIGYYALQATGVITSPTTSWFENKTESAFGRLNYNYDDRYLATINFRADGASQFGTNNKIGYFPSFALAWRLNNEKFIKNALPFIDNLKLRLSYGVAGNDNIPSGLTDLKYSYGTYAGSTTITKVGNYVPNPNLKWEKIGTYNVGLDFGIKNLQAQFDFYVKNSSQLLLMKNVPTETGFSSILVNQGSVQNKGFEATIGYQFENIGGSKFSYVPQLNFAYNKGVITDLGGNVVSTANIWVGQTNYGSVGLREAGQPFNEFWVYHYDGVWQKSEATQAAKYGCVPGEPKIKDVNKDGVIDSKDRYFAGNADPSTTLGFSNRFIYKNFELNAFFQGVFGNKIFNLSQFILDNPSVGYLNNLSPSVLDRWTPTNPSNTEDSKLNPVSSSFAQSDKYLQDGSFFRLKEVTLSYRVPLIHSAIKDLRLRIGVSNVFTITNYQGLNPDVRGVDTQWNMVPYTRTYTFSVIANL